MYCMHITCALISCYFITIENSSKALISTKKCMSHDTCILIPMDGPIGQSVSQIVSHFTHIFYSIPTLIFA